MNVIMIFGYKIMIPYKDILSRPKQFHAQFQRDRPVRTIVSKSAARANITDRLETLARAKDHCNDHYFIDSRKPEESITKVKKGALGYEASDRPRESICPIHQNIPLDVPYKPTKLLGHGQWNKWPGKKSFCYTDYSPLLSPLQTGSKSNDSCPKFCRARTII